MKTSIRKLFIVAFCVVLTSHAFAFTAVTSGLWSNAATWGGVGPGSTVTANDIIIPTGISVDMDVNVSFTGAANQFSVNGTLNSTLGRSLSITAGALSGSGAINIGSLNLTSALATYSFTGQVDVAVFSNQGATVPLASTLNVSDSLDLASGSILLNAGGILNMSLDASINVNSGTLVAGSGLFMATQPYDVYYVGATKTTGLELNSAALRNVNVMLSSNAEDLIINNTVSINGTLDLASGHISMTGSTLNLKGEYMGGAGAMFETNNAIIIIDGPAGTLTRAFDFSVGSTLSELLIDRNFVAFKVESALTITDTMHLLDGTVRTETGGVLTMAAGSHIDVLDGFLVENGGTFDGTLQYNVRFNGPTHPTGVELTGSGLNNLTVELATGGQMITLGTDVVVNGNFVFTRGRFDLDVHRIEFAGTFDQASGTEFLGSSSAIMHFHMTTSVADTVWFDPTAPGMSDIIMEIPVTSTLTTGSNITIHGQLSFISGKLDLGTADMKIRPGASITGYDDTKYVITSDTGTLSIYLTVNNTFQEFPVGTASSYSPAAVQQTDTATVGYVEVRVMSGVYTDGMSGVNIATWESVVNRTWIIWPGPSVVDVMNVRVFWLVGDEVNGFNRGSAYITHYENNMWDSDTAASATTGPFNTYRLTRADGFTTGGPFAVVDSSVPLGVTEVTEAGTDVYPNPSSDVVNVTVSNPANVQHTYELYDAAGRLVSSFSNSNTTNQIDMRKLESGSYILRITNTDGEVVANKRIVKS